MGDLQRKIWTLFLDEGTDNARSQVSLMGRWVEEEGEVQKHFLGLMQMRECKEADFEGVLSYILQSAARFFTFANKYFKTKVQLIGLE